MALFAAGRPVWGAGGGPLTDPAATDATPDVPAGVRGGNRVSALATAFVLVALAGAVWFASPNLTALSRYEADAAELRWIVAAWDRLPRRPLQTETPAPAAALPRSGGRPVQVYHRFAIPRGAARPEALWLPAAAGQVDLYVNGAPIFDEPTASSHYLAVPGSRSLLYPIAPQYLHRGLNRIDIVVTEQRGRALAAPAYLGELQPLRTAADDAAAWTRVESRLLVPLGAVALVASILALAASGAWRLWLPAAAGAAALGARAWLARPEMAASFGRFWPAADVGLLLAALLAGAALSPWIRSGLHPALPLRRRAAAGAAAGLAAATAACSVLGTLSPFDTWAVFVSEIGYGLGAITLMAVAATAAAFAWARATVRFLRERLDLSRLVRRQREEIDTKTLALEQEMRRSAVLEERQRLARDMHDGIGGQLVSLIARVRSRRVGIEQVERELVDGLAELRLVVDSLDAAGDSLADALAVFRMRARPPAEACGMDFAWVQPEELDVRSENPRWTLNIYRFLQEAVSNAVRHSQATALSIAIRHSSPDELTIEVADDGIGLPPDALAGNGAGRGLGHMRERAALLGGAFECGIPDGGRGTIIRLRLPIPRSAPAADQSSGEINPS